MRTKREHYTNGVKVALVGTEKRRGPEAPVPQTPKPLGPLRLRFFVAPPYRPHVRQSDPKQCAISPGSLGRLGCARVPVSQLSGTLERSTVPRITGHPPQPRYGRGIAGPSVLRPGPLLVSGPEAGIVKRAVPGVEPRAAVQRFNIPVGAVRMLALCRFRSV